MPNDEGTPFNEIANAPKTDGLEENPTPESKVEANSAAKEGGTPETETPAFLKQEPAPEVTDEKPDLKIPEGLSTALAANPELKTQVEAFLTAKDKGIDKFIESKQSEIKTLKDQAEANQPLVEFYQKFEDEATVDEAFKDTCIALAKTYKRPFGGFSADGSQVEAKKEESEGDDKSKYGLEFASDDKVVDIAVQSVEKTVRAILDERLGPISEKMKKEEQSSAMTAKISEAVPVLKAEFEVSADPWVTQDLVSAAVKKYPEMTPKEAFAAAYWKEIAAYAVKHSGTKQVRDMPQGGSGGALSKNLKPGATFADIALG